MGLLSWLFPSPADRVEKARKALAAGRFADARDEVLDIELPEARDLLVQAETALARANLEAAVAHGRAGDERRVELHLELAEQFHKGGLEEEFRAARRELRGIRAERSEAEKRAKEDQQARLMSVDPLGIQGGPSWLDPTLRGDLLDPDREELEARVALLVEGYPEALRPRLPELGASFTRAVLDLDEGRPDLALQALLALPDDEPLVCWERARAARALGDSKAAARAARAFATHAGGHAPIGNQHTALFLAEVTAETGDLAGALRVMRSVRATSPDLGGPLYAQLLEATGELVEAEHVLTGLIRQHPRSQGLYGLLARVRIRGGHRTEAIRALEASMEATCCTPGKCGYQPPSLDIVRTLATLYLEDGVETTRGLELAEQAAGLVEQPTFEDAYLAALAARAAGDPQAPQMLAHLRDQLAPTDPRAERLVRHLGA